MYIMQLNSDVENMCSKIALVLDGFIIASSVAR